MAPTEQPESSDHDPELTKFLEGVTELSGGRHARGPEDFIERADRLRTQFLQLCKYRSDRALSSRLEHFAAHRFELVDDPSEYAVAADEVLVLSMVLADRGELVSPALKRSVIILSGVLTVEGVPALFGQSLKRLKQIAHQTEDAELTAWLVGVAKALPGD